MRTGPRYGAVMRRALTVLGAGRRARRAQARGAAVVEFGLVMPIFFTLVVGIIDYGMWFYAANRARHGVREAARMAVVDNYASTACTSDSTPAQKGACLVRLVEDEIAAVSGPAYVRIVPPASW